MYRHCQSCKYQEYCTNIINQQVSAAGSQEQKANQANYNSQAAALALAFDGGTAFAEQNSKQENLNNQEAASKSGNINSICCCDNQMDQFIDVHLDQDQQTEQEQTNCQGAVVAVAHHEGSQAVARQCNEQGNRNDQKVESSSRYENNTCVNESTSTELETHEDNSQPDQSITICKDIRSAGGNPSQNPFKVSVTLKQNGDIMMMEADETGNVKMDGVEEGPKHLDRMKESAGKKDLNNDSDLYIKIDYKDEILEIHSDEQGRIFINGMEVKVEE